MITKPMLAGKCEDITKLTYPVLATPKLDGIRCLVIGGKAVSRRFKPIPNNHIRNAIEASLGYYELDGELMVEGRAFNDLSGDVRREEGKPDFYYAVFDYIPEGCPLSVPYIARAARLGDMSFPSFVRKILPTEIKSAEQLARYEAEMLIRGYEGVMVRSLNSPYKCGRSTANEGYLLKVKRFMDAEAEIVDAEEEMENQNVATKDAFGRTERSSHKGNLKPKGTLGAFVCRNRALWPKDFKIGTGFDAKQRDDYWLKTQIFIARKQKVKFKYQPPPLGAAADERPRIPVFLGFRDEWDT